MDRRIFHGNIKPIDLANALMATFNCGNLQAQVIGPTDKLAVQIATPFMIINLRGKKPPKPAWTISL